MVHGRAKAAAAGAHDGARDMAEPDASALDAEMAAWLQSAVISGADPATAPLGTPAQLQSSEMQGHAESEAGVAVAATATGRRVRAAANDASRGAGPGEAAFFQAMRAAFAGEALPATDPSVLAVWPLLAITGQQLRDQISTATPENRAYVEEFLLDILPDAAIAQLATGVPASITMAQAAQETGWGKSATKGNNFFGIKGEGSAGSTTERTWEVYGGQKVVIDAKFRAYENRFESFIDHGKLLSEDPRYADAMKVRDDPSRMAQAVQDAGYATDPNYAANLQSIMSKYGLLTIDPPIERLRVLYAPDAGGGVGGPDAAQVTRASFVSGVLQAIGEPVEGDPAAVMTQASKLGLATEGAPARVITRAEAAAVLVRAIGADAADIDGRVAWFDDVYEGTWQFAVAHQARLYGIFRGTAENRFMPDEPLAVEHRDAVIQNMKAARVKSIAEQSEHLNRAAPDQPASPEAPWLKVAEGELGVREIAGDADEPRILEYHRAVGLNHVHDETHWCASFVNWALAQAGHTGTGTAWAKDFLNYGQDVGRPVKGSIAVIDWGVGPDGNQLGGHVGFVVGQQGGNILLLGGNQDTSGEVSILPFSASLIKAYVVPSGYVLPTSAAQLDEGQSGDRPLGSYENTR